MKNAARRVAGEAERRRRRAPGRRNGFAHRAVLAPVEACAGRTCRRRGRARARRGPAHRKPRQRGDGSRPSGNSSGTQHADRRRTRRRTASRRSSTTSPRPPVAGVRAVARRTQVMPSADVLKRDRPAPAPSSIEPIGLRGRRAATAARRRRRATPSAGVIAASRDVAVRQRQRRRGDVSTAQRPSRDPGEPRLTLITRDSLRTGGTAARAAASSPAVWESLRRRRSRRRALDELRGGAQHL